MLHEIIRICFPKKPFSIMCHLSGYTFFLFKSTEALFLKFEVLSVHCEVILRIFRGSFMSVFFLLFLTFSSSREDGIVSGNFCVFLVLNISYIQAPSLNGILFNIFFFCSSLFFGMLLSSIKQISGKHKRHKNLKTILLNIRTKKEKKKKSVRN